MSLAVMVPTLEVGESGRAGCLLLLVVLRVQERERERERVCVCVCRPDGG